MRLLSCPNCGAPVDPPPGEERVLTCGFCHRSFERDAQRPAPEPAVRRGGRVPSALGLALAAVGLTGVLALIGVVALGARRQAPPAPVAPNPPPAEPLPPQIPDVPPPRELPVEAGPALDVESVKVALEWKGRLTSSSGAAPPAGSPCTLTATVSSGGSASAREDLLILQCGGRVLYDSSVPLEGMSSSSFGVDEMPVAGEALVFQYAMRAEDLGTRTGPGAQITLSTPDALLEAFRESQPSYRVRATIDRLSSVRRGKAITADAVPLFDAVVIRKAKVTARTGAVPFGGSECELRVSPGYRSENGCRALLTCGGRVLYGGGTQGFVNCQMVDGQPRTFVDAKPTPTDGDPEIHCDLGAGTVVLGDTSANGVTYEVTMTMTGG